MSPVSPDDIANYLNSIASGLWNKEILPYLTSNCRNITFYRQDECEVEYPLYGECITQGDPECIIALDEDGNSVVERKAIEVRLFSRICGLKLAPAVCPLYETRPLYALQR